MGTYRMWDSHCSGMFVVLHRVAQVIDRMGRGQAGRQSYLSGKAVGLENRPAQFFCSCTLCSRSIGGLLSFTLK